MAKSNKTGKIDYEAEISRLRARVAELEARTNGRRRSATAVAMDILKGSSIAKVENDVRDRSFLREEKEAAKKFLDENLDVLNLSKTDYKYNRLVRDIERSRTVKEIDDLMNDIKVMAELEDGLATCLDMANQIGFGHVFANMHLAAKAAMARRAMT